MQQIFTLDQLPQIAKECSKFVKEHPAIAVHGEMGAGKTTFIASLCKALGTHDVTGSPTFSIINEYKTNSGSIIYHMDWYRLKNEEEAIQAGVEDALYSGNLCIVEWPEKAAALLPDNTLHITIAIQDPMTRKLNILGK